MIPSTITRMPFPDRLSLRRSCGSIAVQKTKCLLSISHHPITSIQTRRSCTSCGAIIRAIRQILKDLEAGNIIHHIASGLIKRHVLRGKKYELQTRWSVNCIGEDINELHAMKN